MSGVVWSKFYWSDWANDARLRLCSLASQGLWMRLLCIAAEHDPIGYVCVNDRPLSASDIARLTGASEQEVVDLTAELERNGVFSRDRRGAIYSRRMVKEVRQAAISRKNGKMGGNPSLSKQNGNPGQDNPPLKPEDITQEPIASTPEEETANAVRPKRRQRRSDYDEEFQRFWEEYPTDALMSKAEAAKAWDRLSGEDRAAAAMSLTAFRAHCERNPDYRPVHAVRYLSQRRFEGFLKAAKAARAVTIVSPGSPQWVAWRDYKQSIGERTTFMESEARAGRGLTVPSEWPPSHSQAA